ncbi:MAG: V4R domain-containing protein [Methanobacterium sp.]
MFKTGSLSKPYERVYDPDMNKFLQNIAKFWETHYLDNVKAIFSKYFGDRRNVDETKCYAMGDEYCCFEIEKVNE